jgi:hypothetical protein
MSIMPLFTYPNLSPYSHGVITVLWDLQIFSCPQIRMRHVSTLPHHPSGRPPIWLHLLSAFGAGMTSDVEPPPPWDLQSDLLLLLELRVADLILRKRQRWAVTFILGRRFIWKCIRWWASIWELPWPSSHIPNTLYLHWFVMNCYWKIISTGPYPSAPIDHWEMKNRCRKSFSILILVKNRYRYCLKLSIPVVVRTGDDAPFFIVFRFVYWLLASRMLTILQFTNMSPCSTPHTRAPSAATIIPLHAPAITPLQCCDASCRLLCDTPGAVAKAEVTFPKKLIIQIQFVQSRSNFVKSHVMKKLHIFYWNGSN